MEVVYNVDCPYFSSSCYEYGCNYCELAEALEDEASFTENLLKEET